jgi:hypothetical protein
VITTKSNSVSLGQYSAQHRTMRLEILQKNNWKTMDPGQNQQLQGTNTTGIECHNPNQRYDWEIY